MFARVVASHAYDVCPVPDVRFITTSVDVVYWVWYVVGARWLGRMRLANSCGARLVYACIVQTTSTDPVRSVATRLHLGCAGCCIKLTCVLYGDVWRVRSPVRSLANKAGWTLSDKGLAVASRVRGTRVRALARPVCTHRCVHVCSLFWSCADVARCGKGTPSSATRKRRSSQPWACRTR